MSNEHKPFYAANSDYSNEIFSDTLRVVGTIQSVTGFKYKLYCDPSIGGCGCTGQVVTAKQLAQTEVGTLKCANAGHGRTEVNRPTAASVQIRQKQDVISSPRQRMEVAARAKEQKEFESAQ
jgi:hypothetical protein